VNGMVVLRTSNVMALLTLGAAALLETGGEGACSHRGSQKCSHSPSGNDGSQFGPVGNRDNLMAHPADLILRLAGTAKRTRRLIGTIDILGGTAGGFAICQEYPWWTLTPTRSTKRCWRCYI
jgi:hypothetical protein